MLLARYMDRLVFGSTVRQRTWKKLAAQLRNGIPLNEALQIVRDQALRRKARVGQVYATILRNMASAHGMGTALTGLATQEEIMLIASGQKAGKLYESLVLAAELLQARQAILRAVLSAVTYPLFLMGLCVTLLIVVSVQVIPQLAILSSPERWTGAAGILYAVSSFVNSWTGLVALSGTAALLVCMLVTLPSWTGPRRLMMENLPPWSIYRLTVGSVWLFTLATMMRSGMSLSQSLDEMMSSKNTTPYLRERVQGIRRCSRHGENLGEAMQNSGLAFPSTELVDDIVVYARMPGFQNRVHELADQWMDEGVEMIQRNAKVLNSLFLVLIIVQVAGLALAVVSLQSQLLPG